ncbi:MAG TPA: hypothetical protein VKU83_06030, partial [Puia sp.]|nr:hypothetical protein [Puia sp.]
PNFWQKKRLAQHNHTIWVFYIFSILAILFAVIGIRYGNDPGRIKALPIIACVLVVICGIIAVASIDTSHEKEFQLPKIQYDSLKNAGAIDHYIDQHLLQ